MFDYYNKKIFLFFMNKNIGKNEILDYRRKILTRANGEILEIGIGTGINLLLYPDSITHIKAIDTFACELPQSRVKVEFYNMSADNMFFCENAFDTVVSTFSLCSIKNIDKALLEIRRVLKPNGRLLFLEHGKAKSKVIAAMQNIANPLFNIFACGCNINRDYTMLLEGKGFIIDGYGDLQANINPKLLAGHLYFGSACNGGIA